MAQCGDHSLAVGRWVARRRKLEVEVQVARVALPYNLVVVAGARWRGRGSSRGCVPGGIAAQLAIAPPEVGARRHDVAPAAGSVELFRPAASLLFAQVILAVCKGERLILQREYVPAVGGGGRRPGCGHSENRTSSENLIGRSESLAVVGLRGWV
eukprot:scaffold48852_cov30-Phaeocystis_antarctica.AAC.1